MLDGEIEGIKGNRHVERHQVRFKDDSSSERVRREVDVRPGYRVDVEDRIVHCRGDSSASASSSCMGPTTRVPPLGIAEGPGNEVVRVRHRQGVRGSDPLAVGSNQDDDQQTEPENHRKGRLHPMPPPFRFPRAREYKKTEPVTMKTTNVMSPMRATRSNPVWKARVEPHTVAVAFEPHARKK